MSTKAKMTLGASIVLCCGTIYGVHYLQRYEKELMALGVEKDEERRKKREQRELNMKELEDQHALHKALLETQSVSKAPSNEPASEDA
ncbi:uncharacterized protein BYT42DRAFT_609147 [Radiomyces spectabilis]|uniref:uncharacterized protein n=1 Tax=Radiomyces spectabilis TaxID=64574 RepID=UPI002220230F|nr:uncharacterized protein BYT42DRAFT_609147 [Radiomyces spectabilis]KAI8393346.1 hypothetical protein BYT42DRAFT_609147 [Radiomyces spectabilis]